MRLNIITGACTAALALAAAGAAGAQNMDYGSLQTLFGEPVTTSATGTPQKASEVTVDMTIITADQIRQNGSRSIPQLLSSIPGLGILQETATGFDIGVRGYNQPMQPSMLVLINGRQVFSDDYSRTIWENLPVNIDDIRQIEVVKGAASALFGSNAAHGVINIVTYSAQYDPVRTVTVGGGTQDAKVGDMTFTTKLNPSTSVKFSIGGLAESEFKTPRRTTGVVNELTVEQVPTHFYVAASGQTQINKSLEGFSEFTYSRSMGNEAYYSGFLAGVDDTTYSVRGGFEWQTPIGTIKSDTFLNHAYVDNHEVSTFMSRYHDVTDAVTTKLEDQFKIGSDHTFRLSAEFVNKAFALTSPNFLPTTTSIAAASKITTQTSSVGAMWLWHITDKLEMTNAARLDHQALSETGPLAPASIVSAASFNHSNDDVSLNDGIVYKVTSNDILRLSFARGVELPSLLDYGFNVLEPGTNKTATMFVGNPKLKPLIEEDYQLGFDHKFPQIFSVLKTSIFYEDNRDVISPFSNLEKFTLPTSGGVAGPLTVTVRQATNLGSSHGVGGEVQLVGATPWGLRWDISYSYAHAHDEHAIDNPPGPTVSIWGFENSMPNHIYRAAMGYSTGPWEFDVDALVGTSFSLNRTTISRPVQPGYYTLSGRAAYRLTKMITFGVSGTSLVYDAQGESPFPQVERQILATLNGKF